MKQRLGKVIPVTVLIAGLSLAWVISDAADAADAVAEANFKLLREMK